jgi:drug/metabolite transporter (DMT)-like permease
MSKRTLAHLLLFATALVWGATFSLVKAAIADVSPLLFNLLRMTLASVVLVIINRRALREVSRPQLLAGALAGLFLGAGYQFQTLGLAHTTPAKCAFITGMLVVLVPVFTLVPAIRPAGTPRPTILAGIGTLLGFAGLVLITTPAGTVLRNLASSMATGDLIAFIGAVAFAAHLLTLAHSSRSMPAGVLATLQVSFATLTMLITLPLEHTRASFTPPVMVALVVCSLLGTVAAFTIQSFAQQVLPPTHTVLILTFEPVFAWLTSLLFFHEVLGGRALLGAALILAGIALVELLPAANATEIPA